MSGPDAAVLLVNPRMCSRNAMRLPLSLLHLSAVLGDRPQQIVDGNVDAQAVRTALAALASRPHALVGITVMPGPQVATAIEMSAAIRAAFPSVPIAWGGYFPTLYPDAAINAPYVDYLVRGQGEDTLSELLGRLPDAGAPSPSESAADPSAILDVAGLTWKRGGSPVHNPERRASPPGVYPPLPYDRAGDVPGYLRPSFMGTRTAVHQAAIGCRYKCEFCGVVSMWNGKTILEMPDRLLLAGRTLRDRYGANAMQFYDHNFFDREDTSIPVLEALADLRLPWWCYARADTLAKFSASTWRLIEKSQLRMAYIGAEAGSDDVLARMRKGTRVEHTLEVAARSREQGVSPEFSFVLGGPEDAEGEVEKTFAFISRVKRIHPGCEIILYFYSPTPQRDRTLPRSDPAAARLVLERYGPSGPPLPTTPEEWTQPRWVRFVCHQDAPWLTPALRRRVKDFACVLSCRFPTVQDYRTPEWGKSILRNLARIRYASGRYDHPWELAGLRRLIPLRDPQKESL